MAKNLLNNVIFQDATKAREWLESLLWANGRPCGYCGTLEASTPISTRPGYYQCKACRKQFTVMVGTVFERSHIPLNKWLMAAFLLSASKKGISAHQAHRMLGITYKSAWFMWHRLREAMKSGQLPPLGGEGKAVEADETFIGRKDGQPKRRGGYSHKNAVLSLVERGGAARSFHIDKVGAKEVGEIVAKNVKRETTLMTDEGRHYETVGKQFADHQTVEHMRGEYARGDAHTNTVEGFYSIFKRGMKERLSALR